MRTRKKARTEEGGRSSLTFVVLAALGGVLGWLAARWWDGQTRTLRGVPRYPI